MRAISQSLAPVREHRLRPSSLVLVLQAVTNWIVYSQHAAGKEIPAIFESIAKQLEDKSHTLCRAPRRQIKIAMLIRLTIFTREIAFSRVPMMGFEPIPRLRENGF